MKTARITPRRRVKVVAKSGDTAAEECDLSVVSETFGFLIRAAQVQTFHAFYQEFGEEGLTPGSYAALAIVGSNPGIRQGFVAKLLSFRESNMTKLVKELSGAGLIHRVRRFDDQRATGLELTEKGSVFVADMNTKAFLLDERHTACLNKNERLVIIDLLKKILQTSYGTVSDLVAFHD